MNIIEIILISIGLAMDAFAVAVACSIALHRVSSREIFRLAFHFGLFQAIMPILGWSAGISARQYIEMWDHWLAFGLLVFIGGKSVYEAFRKKDNHLERNDPTRGLLLVIFSVATSIDALAVGISLAAINVDIWQPAIIIGIVTLLMTIIGMVIGKKIGIQYGRWIEVVGGMILIGIGVKILISHSILT